jgi:hypothetical protein
VIDRLEEGDDVEFTIVHDEGSTHVHGTVCQRAGRHIRVDVDEPGDLPGVTLVGDDEFAPALTVRRDYTWELLGTAALINVLSSDYKTVIHAR